MITRERYITNSKGKKISVILPIKAYEYMLEELEEQEDVRLYDEAKKEGDGEYILFTDYIKNRERREKNV